jgi:hypothetical protein
MMTMEYATDRLSAACRRFQGYDVELKKEFGAAARAFLRVWAAKHGQVGKIEWNKAGCAMSGEVSFRAADYVIWVQADSCAGLPPVMFRKQVGYGAGEGSNNFATPEKFASMSLEVFEKLIGRQFGTHPPVIMDKDSTYAWDMCKGKVEV